MLEATINKKIEQDAFQRRFGLFKLICYPISALIGGLVVWIVLHI